MSLKTICVIAGIAGMITGVIGAQYICQKIDEKKAKEERDLMLQSFKS